MSDNPATFPAANNLPASSLLICSRNRPQLLLESVESVLSGDAVPTELLIMDQSDRPHPILQNYHTERPCEVRYVPVRVVGECPSKNIGMRLARYDILVFTDDDILATPGWFGALVRALEAAGPRGVVTGQVFPTEPASPGGFAPTKKVDPRPAIYQGRVGEDVLFPMNMAMYRSAIETVGDFDERFGAGGPFHGAEDNDLGYRLLEAGYRIHYVPEAGLYHRAWRGAQDYVRTRWIYGYCQGAFYAKYLSLRDPYMLRRMAWDLFRHAKRLPRRIVRLEQQW
ncbi:MAG TPA: glycosyltransferase, partial [Roseiflexaceae bacterium]|nr:glycosyltransferase [Roseiflexaceae bacterium]